MLINRSQTPILAIDKPWEKGGVLAAVGGFLEPDGETIRLYYRARFTDNPLKDVLCVAFSTDLKTWHKPKLRDGTNIVKRSSGTLARYGTFHASRIICDDATGTWTLLYWDRLSEDLPPGYCLATSTDGLHWQTITERPFITTANDAASMIAVHDTCPTPLGKATHYIYQQTWKYSPDMPQERDNIKGICRYISLWRTNGLTGTWRGPIHILAPDHLDPTDVQFYWLATFHVDGGYGGFLHCHHTTDQTMDVQLVTSRDGWGWTRCLDRQPILPLGPAGNFDCGMVAAVGAPVQWQGRTLVFYSGRATVHDGQPHLPDSPLPNPANGIGIAEFTHTLMHPWT